MMWDVVAGGCTRFLKELDDVLRAARTTRVATITNNTNELQHCATKNTQPPTEEPKERTLPASTSTSTAVPS
jgi:hypothetical protein